MSSHLSDPVVVFSRPYPRMFSDAMRSLVFVLQRLRCWCVRLSPARSSPCPVACACCRSAGCPASAVPPTGRSPSPPLPLGLARAALPPIRSAPSPSLASAVGRPGPLELPGVLPVGRGCCIRWVEFMCDVVVAVVLCPVIFQPNMHGKGTYSGAHSRLCAREIVAFQSTLCLRWLQPLGAARRDLNRSPLSLWRRTRFPALKNSQYIWARGTWQVRCSRENWYRRACGRISRCLHGREFCISWSD